MEGREDDSLWIYHLFQWVREVFFTNFLDGEFLKFMDKKKNSMLF